MDVKQYLTDYTNVIKWDVDKLTAVAEQGENYQREIYKSHLNLGISQDLYATKTQSTLVTDMVTPPTGSNALVENTNGSPSTRSSTGLPQPSSTISISDSFRSKFILQHTAGAAKCAVPMALTLISSIEFLGALLYGPAVWTTGNKFELAAREFFKYGNSELDRSEENLIREVYRNGMSHGFLPKGVKIAIDYQTRFEIINDVIFIENAEIILNVNQLKKVCYTVFGQIIDDTAKYLTFEAGIGKFEEAVEKKTVDIIQRYRDYAANRI